MVSVINGTIAAGIFLAFTVGLAFSINAAPFFVIVGFVGILMLFDFYQGAKEDLQDDSEDY